MYYSSPCEHTNTFLRASNAWQLRVKKASSNIIIIVSTLIFFPNEVAIHKTIISTHHWQGGKYDCEVKSSLALCIGKGGHRTP